MIRILRSQSGTANIEATVALPALVILISGALSVFYFSFSLIWIERNSYEAIVCLSTSAPVRDCRERLKARLNHALPIGEIKHLQLRRAPSEARVEISFEVAKALPIKHQVSRRLPLKVKL